MSTKAETEAEIASVARAGRRARATLATYVLGSALLLLAVLVMVNWLAFRHYERWDWTSAGYYTLSDRSREELKALDRQVDFYLFLSQADPNYPETDELLRRYEAASPKFRVQRIDPDRNPARYQALAQRFGVGATLSPEQMVVDAVAVLETGDKHWTLGREDLITEDLEAPPGSDDSLQLRAEEAVTGAIVKLTTGRTTHVCVSQGHGEWRVQGGDERNIATLAARLKRDNLEVRAVRLIDGRPVPTECDAVFVIDPRSPFRTAEAQALKDYVKGGGGLLLALDPVLRGAAIQSTGFESLLDSWGVALDGAVVMEADPARLLPPGDPRGPFLVRDYGEHPITRALRAYELPTIVTMMQSVRASSPAAVEVLKGSDRSWAETDLAALQEGTAERDERDVAGPASLAVALELPKAQPLPKTGPADNTEERRGRVVVIGGSTWLSGITRFGEGPDNFDLASALTGWLTQRAALISIAPKRLSSKASRLSEEDLSSILIRVLVLLPAAILLLGISTWWARRT